MLWAYRVFLLPVQSRRNRLDKKTDYRHRFHGTPLVGITSKTQIGFLSLEWIHFLGISSTGFVGKGSSYHKPNAGMSIKVDVAEIERPWLSTRFCAVRQTCTHPKQARVR